VVAQGLVVEVEWNFVVEGRLLHSYSLVRGLVGGQISLLRSLVHSLVRGLVSAAACFL
jgi:hypothetical protein